MGLGLLATDCVADLVGRCERRGAMEARVATVVAVDDAVEDRRGVARCLGSDLGGALEHERAHAAARQRGGDRAAGEAGADHDDVGSVGR